jgi:hypothetical protein
MEYKEIKSRRYIQDLIGEGEHENQDFKFEISDAMKIARTISAFANHSGGRLLIGVKDNGKISGIKSDEEIYMIDQAASMYCRPPQAVKCQVYRVEGKSVLKADIAAADNRPVKAPDNDRKWKAYYRVKDENILASPLHVKAWLHERLNVDGTLLTLTGAEKKLLELIESTGAATVDEYKIYAHISGKVAEDAVVRMYSMGIIGFSYDSGANNKLLISLKK